MYFGITGTRGHQCLDLALKNSDVIDLGCSPGISALYKLLR